MHLLYMFPAGMQEGFSSAAGAAGRRAALLKTEEAGRQTDKNAPHADPLHVLRRRKAEAGQLLAASRDDQQPRLVAFPYGRGERFAQLIGKAAALTSLACQDKALAGGETERNRFGTAVSDRGRGKLLLRRKRVRWCRRA